MSVNLIFAHADCPECKWSTDGRNAMGLAAQHANRTGHRAYIECEYAAHPDPTKAPKAKAAK